MNSKISKELIMHRIEQSKSDLSDAKFLYNNNSYLSANNRAYYSIFHAIRAVLALEPIDFKRHKDVLSHFNKNYVNTEIFPKAIGKRIVQANRIREDSDYDDEYVARPEVTEAQIKTAEELVALVDKYMKSKI
ncbi:MAG: HEPN domain-containing protein [Clostridia bacterium]|nr:HEPN domain-containing protein [Clostridia bacterium]